MNTILLAAQNSGMGIFKPLYWLFGKCMGFLMEMLGNRYFIAIIIFTVATRLILLPFNIRQQRTMAATTRLQPKIQKIQKKYSGNDPRDRQRLNEEMQALYQREGHNPMNMGCGTMAFQMIFLMGIVGIIYYPIQYVLGINIDKIATQIAELVNYKGGYLQLHILEEFTTLQPTLTEHFPKVFTESACNDILAYRSGMELFGLDMTAIPHWKDGLIVIVPILSFATSMLSSVVSMLIQKKNNPAAAQQGMQMIMMTLLMPFFSLYITFKVPAAVGVYWIVSNIVAVLQQLYIAKFFPPKKSQARLMVEKTIERRSREETIKKIK